MNECPHCHSCCSVHWTGCPNDTFESTEIRYKTFDQFMRDGFKCDLVFWIAVFLGPITPRLAVAWARAQHYPRDVTPIKARFLGVPYISGYKVSPPELKGG